MEWDFPSQLGNLLGAQLCDEETSVREADWVCCASGISGKLRWSTQSGTFIGISFFKFSKISSPLKFLKSNSKWIIRLETHTQVGRVSILTLQILSSIGGGSSMSSILHWIRMSHWFPIRRSRFKSSKKSEASEIASIRIIQKSGMLKLALSEWSNYPSIFDRILCLVSSHWRCKKDPAIVSGEKISDKGLPAKAEK